MIGVSPRNGNRLEVCNFISVGDLILGGRKVDGDQAKSAILRGKHREDYCVHRDSLKCQRRDCWESGHSSKLESWAIQERRKHVQERPNGLSALPQTDSRRESNSHRTESIHSGTSTISDHPTFGSSSGVAETEKLSSNVDSSSSPGMDIPPLVCDTADSMSNISEVQQDTPRFAETVRKELDALHRTVTKSDVVNRINLPSRSPMISMGSEDSAGKNVMPDLNIPSKLGFGAPSSLAPREFYFDTVAKGQRPPL